MKQNIKYLKITFSARQTKTDTCENIVDLDEASYQDLQFVIQFLVLYCNLYFHQGIYPNSRMDESPLGTRG